MVSGLACMSKKTYSYGSPEIVRHFCDSVRSLPSSKGNSYSLVSGIVASLDATTSVFLLRLHGGR